MLFSRKNRQPPVILLQGGVGSQLFQFFAGLDVGFTLGLESVKFDFIEIETRKQHSGDLRDFSFGALDPFFDFFTRNKLIFKTRKLASYLGLENILPPDNLYISRTSGYDSELLRGRNYRFFKGHFNCMNHIERVEKRIGISLKNEITLKVESELFKTLLKELSDRRPLIIQVRRGDYLHKQHQLGLLSKTYFMEAIIDLAGAARDKEILILTDSPSQVLGLMSELSMIGYDASFLSEKVSVPETLMLMSQGSGYAISNSSFGWWGAFLASHTSTVIYPKPWFINSNIEPRNLIPKKPNWREKESIWINENTVL